MIGVTTFVWFSAMRSSRGCSQPMTSWTHATDFRVKGLIAALSGYEISVELIIRLVGACRGRCVAKLYTFPACSRRDISYQAVVNMLSNSYYNSFTQPISTYRRSQKAVLSPPTYECCQKKLYGGFQRLGAIYLLAVIRNSTNLYFILFYHV